MKPPFPTPSGDTPGYALPGGGVGPGPTGITAPAPTSFLPGQSYYELQQQQAPCASKPERRTRNRSVAPPPPPVLTVHSDGRCQLSIPFAVAAGLAHGKPFDLVVPRQRGGHWYLETYRTAGPKPGQGYVLPADPRCEYQVRIRKPVSNLFRRPQPVRVGAAALITGNVNLPVASLRFTLGPEVAGHPGYFELLPVAAPGPVSRNGQPGPGEAGAGG